MGSLDLFGVTISSDLGWSALDQLDTLQYSSDQVESEGDWTLYIAESVKALWFIISIFARWTFALPIIMNGVGFPFLFVSFALGSVSIVYILAVAQILGSVRLG